MLTEIDYKIYQQFYKWDSMKILYAKSAYKKPLPDYLTQALAFFYRRKSELKKQLKTDKSEALKKEYLKIKGMLNSCYGMCVSRLNTTDIIYNDCGEWEEVEGKPYAEIIKKQFLSPYWGIYVTAYCRERILTAFKKLGNNALYGDTDSVKVQGDFSEIFDNINAEIMEMNRKICTRLKLDYNLYRDIGTFDNEGTYSKFKTYGAKRYVYTHDNETTAVIAGLPSAVVDEFISKNGQAALYDFFENGMLFENCGKNAHHYADYSETIINGEKMTEYGSCYIFPVNFEMRVDSVFLALINERREIQEQGGLI